MRSVKFLIAAGAASLLSSAAFAADMPSIMPPPPQYYAPPPVQDFGGWYLRGDIGMTNTTGKLFAPAYNDVSTLSVTQLGHEFTGGTMFDLGVGYRFNSWFRADITGEYRSNRRCQAGSLPRKKATAAKRWAGRSAWAKDERSTAAMA